MNARHVSLFQSGVITSLVVAFSFGLPKISGANDKAAKTMAKYFVPYMPAASAEYLRLTVTTPDSLDQLDAKATTALILRPNFLPPPPVLIIPIDGTLRNNGMAGNKTVFIDYRLPRPAPKTPQATFFPLDKVFIQTALDPAAKAKTLRISDGARWRNGDGAVGAQSDVADFKLNGFRIKPDPEYTVYNDLDPTLFADSDARFEIRNLRFFSDISESAFDSIDLAAVYSESFNSSLDDFTLSSSQASLPSFPTEKTFFDPFADPNAGNFSGAIGQIYDPTTGVVIGSFVQSIQAVPEPGALVLLTGLIVSGFSLAKYRKCVGH